MSKTSIFWIYINWTCDNMLSQQTENYSMLYPESNPEATYYVVRQDEAF